jgi:hypothetical protein
MTDQSFVYNARKYGAAGDGRIKDTLAIQTAIDDCSSCGGGTVYFPNGSYLTGTIYMRSNVTLYLEVSAILLGSPDISDYTADTHKQRYDHEAHMDRCLIFSKDIENIGFAGAGMIDGQGECFPNKGDVQRPMLMRFLGCRNVRLKDIRLVRPAAWTTAFISCETVFADSLDICSLANQNGDGLDFDNCRNVFVCNCKFDTSDDSICLQNSEKGSICSNIAISNCIMKSKWAAIRIGLLSSGDIENVTVSNCIFHDIDCSGLKIQSTEGGHIRNMLFENIVMYNVPRPVFLTFNHFHMGTDAPENPPKTGGISNLRFQNFRITYDSNSNAERYKNPGILLIGTSGHYIEDISISGFDYTVPGGAQIPVNDVELIPEMTYFRPEAYVYERGLPVSGMYARHSRRIFIKDMRLKIVKQDTRHVLVFDDVIGSEIDGFSIDMPEPFETPILLINASDVDLNKLKVNNKADKNLLKVIHPSGTI